MYYWTHLSARTFIIDKYYGAKHIIEELDLAKAPKIKKKQEIQSKVMDSEMKSKKKQKVKINSMGVKVSSEKN